MTERKPRGVSFEGWVDRQIRESRERGEFDNLAGAGRPIVGLDGTHDESWWVRAKLKREDVSWLPPALALRKDAEQAHQGALAARTEADARHIVEEVNGRIREAIRIPPAGPPMTQMPLDVERVLGEWRDAHPAAAGPPSPPPPEDVPRRRRHLRRWLGRGSHRG